MAMNRKQTYLDKIMMAVTFAEAGEYGTAKSMLGDEIRKQQRPDARPANRPSIDL